MSKSGARLKVGWIGLGKMGLPITTNLLKAGFDLTVFDTSPDLVAKQVASGALAASNVLELAQSVDVVISAIPDDIALRAIALGNDGLLAASRRGAIYVDMSTVSPQASALVRRAASERGVDYIAAPVSGSTVLAENAQLTVFASGPAQAYALVKAIFDAVSSKQFYVGDEEQARYLKLAINHLVGSTAVILGEALSLGQKGGLDWVQMLDVIGDSVVGSPLIKYKLDALKRRDFAPAFSSRQMLKDMSLVVAAGDSVGVRMDVANIVKSMFASYEGEGGGELDFFSILLAINSKAPGVRTT
jgi:3-hydroxyisobutyrate dehydrogenase-like beta-hydroxyacid dehydrogenase